MSGHPSKHAARQTDKASSPCLFGSLPNTATASKQVEKPSGGGIFGGGPATSVAAQRDGKTSGEGLFGDRPATSTAAQRDGKTSGEGLFGDRPATSTAAQRGGKTSGAGLFGDRPATSTVAQRGGKTSGAGLFGSGPATSTAAQPEAKLYGGGLFGQASTVAPSQEAEESSVETLNGRAPAITATDQQGATMSREGGLFGGLPGAAPTSTQTAGSFGRFGAAANTATPATQQGTAMLPKGESLGEAGKTRTPAQQKENPLSTGLVGGGHTSATSLQQDETSSGIAPFEGPTTTTALAQPEPTVPSEVSKASASPTNHVITSPSKSLVPEILPESPTDAASLVPTSKAGPVVTQEEQDLKPSYQFNADNLVTLLVGPDQQRMVVHKRFITQTSAFFVGRLQQELAEGQTHTIKLPEETPELKAHYLDWVYTTELPSRKFSFFSTTTDQKVAAYNLLAELYVLGERRLDSTFRNAVTAEIVRLRPSQFGLHECQLFQQGKMVNTIYQGTSAGSPARRLMVDLSLKFGCPQCLTEVSEKAFLLDLTHAFFVVVGSPRGVESKRELELRAGDYQI